MELLIFASVGAAATALHYLVYASGLAWTTWPAAASSAAGYLAGSVLSYALNYHLTFRSQRRHAVALSRFYIMVLSAFILNAALVGLMVDMSGVNAWVGAGHRHAGVPRFQLRRVPGPGCSGARHETAHLRRDPGFQ